MLRVNPNSATQNTRAFQDAQARLRGYPRARSMQEIAQNGQSNPNQGNYPTNDGRYPQDSTYGGNGRIAYPSTRYQTTGNNLFRAQIPDNWRQLGGDGNSVSYAPEGAYGQSGITHGVMFGTDREQYADLQRASQQYVSDLMQVNNYLRQQGGFQRTTVSGRNALVTSLVGRSPITNRNERVTIVTTVLGGGDLFFMAAVAPNDEYNSYQRAFTDIMRSVQLNIR